MSFTDWILTKILPEPIIPEYIATEVLEECLNAAQGEHPNEFLALLTAEHSSNVTFSEGQPPVEDAYIITSYYVIPGTKSSPVAASVDSINIPVSDKIVGSFHSHPNGTTHPSPEDSNMFRKYPINIIAGSPYTMNTFSVYGPDSELKNIEQVSVKEKEIDSIWFEGIK